MSGGVSLRNACFGLILLAAALPATLSFLWGGVKVYERLLENALFLEHHFNEKVHDRLEAEIARYTTLLRSESDPMAFTLARDRDLSLLTQMLGNILEREPAITALLIVDMDGRVITGLEPRFGLDAQRALASPDEDRQWLYSHWDLEPEGRSPALLIPLAGQRYIGPAVRHEDMQSFIMAVPVAGAGRPLAVLLAEIDVERLWLLLRQSETETETITYLVDRRGILLISLQQMDHRPGEPLTHLGIVRAALADGGWNQEQVYTGLKGVPVFGTLTPIKTLNWAVISEVPEEAVAAPIRDTLMGAAALVAVMVLVFGALGLWLVRRILRPVDLLTAACDQVAGGDYSPSMPPSRFKEFKTLATGFNSMVSERRLAEDKLKNYHYHLEQQVAERTASLEASNRELEAYSYSIAHDLRTPLRAITSFSQVLLEDAGHKLDEVERDSLLRVVGAGKYMAQLIDDILELARIGRSEFRCQSIDLSGMARKIASHLTQRQPEREVEFSIQEGVTVRGDQSLLRIMLENLLDNAWKYSGREQKARIEFGAMEQGAERVYYVRDNGVGFDMKYAGKLFHAFQRLHKGEEFEGTGIGLATVARVIQRHDGRVWAEAEEGKGVTFYFTLGTSE